MAFVCQQGATVAGRYRLDRLLGEGGMGAVWSATHSVTRKAVALKFLKTMGDARPEVRRRFLREARAASVLRHPNVVQVHDILELDDGGPVMVMDLLDGETLGDKLARERVIALDELARILVPVISAVGTAHAAGIIHRDLKPDNIFLVELPDGAGYDVKVLDFGIAKLTATEGDAAQTQEGGGITRTGDMVGTPYYMSPEQAFGENDVDHRADVWALGVILYECLTGKRPFQGDNIGQILKRIITGAATRLEVAMPGLPRDITQLVGRMLSQERSVRPNDLREVQQILRKHTDAQAQSFGTAMQSTGSGKIVIGSSPDRAPAERTDPLAATTYASPKRRLAVVASASAGLLLIAAGIGWRFGHAVEPPTPTAPAPAPMAPPPVAPVPLAATAPVPIPAAAPPPAAPIVAEKPARPGHRASARPGAKRAEAPRPVAPAATAPIVPVKKSLPGGVVDQVPF